MTVRFAMEKDVPRILELLKQVNRVHADLRPDLFMVTTKYNHDNLMEIINDENQPVFVCVDHNNIVLGYGICKLVDYDKVDLRTNITTLYIDDICVDEAHRKQGVAAAVFQEIKSWAKIKGCYNIELNVWEGNTSAEKFYDSQGMGTMKTTKELIL